MIVKTVGDLKKYIKDLNDDTPIVGKGVDTTRGCDTCGYGSSYEGEVEINDLETRLVIEVEEC